MEQISNIEENEREILDVADKNLLQEINAGVKNLNDLFVRRLFEDKQKNELIDTLSNLADYSVLEPFIYDLILLLDRVERIEGDFAKSVEEEILELLGRRGVHKIKVSIEYNPDCNKVIKVIEDPKISSPKVAAIVRNGYYFGEKVIRPAEVVLAKPDREALDFASSNLRSIKNG